jgi:D-glycero-alpha-D-manno-heptose 1-phosphate guanylyltransferase
LSEQFSFEKEYLEKYTGEGHFFGAVQNGYFIDIGIPSDFKKAQQDLAPATFDIAQIDKSFALFLDRDGVINVERPGAYVLAWEQFQFSDGALKAIGLLTQKAGFVFVVSNQRGVGKGLMTEASLKQIHDRMEKEVLKWDGRIDSIYYCIEKEPQHFNRKPNPGMAYQAFRDFPQINQQKCVMIGNKLSDMRFGRFAGMFTIYITSTNPEVTLPHPDIDAAFPSLLAFAEALQS